MDTDGSNQEKIKCENEEINTNVNGYLFSNHKIILFKNIKANNIETSNEKYKTLSGSKSTYFTNDLNFKHWDKLMKEIQQL